ncbi:CcdB family protein [Thalassospira australica]|uniref:CcdB family protein n=1 Tax=Thalassospira australica TaxID=1528106 RepID=UPI00384C70EF
MARFDIHKLANGYVVDVQADLLADLNTRVVVPLCPHSEMPKPIARLNPVIMIGDTRWVLLPQFIATVAVKELGEVVGEFSEKFALTDALDMVFRGI